MSSIKYKELNSDKSSRRKYNIRKKMQGLADLLGVAIEREEVLSAMKMSVIRSLTRLVLLF